MVVDGGEVGREQHQHLGQVQVVDAAVGESFEPAHRVVGEVPDEPAGERGHPGKTVGGEQPQRFRERRERVPVRGAPSGTDPHQCASPSTTVSAAGAPAPMNDHRDHDRPFSADSSRNVPGRSPASLR